jgi:tRNA dimethylallyltransferase
MTLNNRKRLIVLCGPTGIGKTKIAVELAKSLACDIISADSRQLYKEMRIGTAVPSEKELLEVTHHFIQSHSIHDYYNASMFEMEVLNFLQHYFTRKNTIILSGGSGLYIKAVCEGIDELPAIDLNVRKKWQYLHSQKGLEYLQSFLKKNDPSYFQDVDKDNPKRLLKAIEIIEMTGKTYSSFLKKVKVPRPFQIVKIGLNTDRTILYNKINERVDRMMKEGLLEEAHSLYIYKNLTPLNTVGYKELFAYFDGRLSLEETTGQIKNHSRAYARRQLTWFRRDSTISWFEPEDLSGIKKYIDVSVY